MDREREQPRVPRAHRRSQQFGDLAWSEVRCLLRRDPGASDHRGWIGSERTVADRRVEHSAEDCVGRADRRLGQTLAAELDQPALHV
jgi:hypothetical protein